jgi:hypothetical protein
MQCINFLNRITINEIQLFFFLIFHSLIYFKTIFKIRLQYNYILKCLMKTFYIKS